MYGPYEEKTVLAQGKTDVNGPHQGAWVETKEANKDGIRDWFFHFQDVGAAGRIVHLQPVKWLNDWPEMGYKGEPITGLGRLQNGEKTYANLAHRDEFDRGELGLDWQWSGGEAKPQWFFCDVANSQLRLYSAKRTEELMPNMLLQKIPAVAFTATARVRFAPNTDKKMVGAEHAGMIVFGLKSFTVEAPGTNEWCYLRLEMNEQQIGQFFTSKDGQNWIKAGEEFQAVEGKWIGAQVGLYCTRDDRKFNDAGWLDVDWFEISLE